MVSYLSTWKRELLERASERFDSKAGNKSKSHQDEVDNLYRQIGQLSVERDFFSTQARSLKKTIRLSLVERHHPDISILRQCRLLGISRSSVYYQSRKDLTNDLELMRLID